MNAVRGQSQEAENSKAAFLSASKNNALTLGAEEDEEQINKNGDEAEGADESNAVQEGENNSGSDSNALREDQEGENNIPSSSTEPTGTTARPLVSEATTAADCGGRAIRRDPGEFTFLSNYLAHSTRLPLLNNYNLTRE